MTQVLARSLLLQGSGRKLKQYCLFALQLHFTSLLLSILLAPDILFWRNTSAIHPFRPRPLHRVSPNPDSHSAFIATPPSRTHPVILSRTAKVQIEFLRCPRAPRKIDGLTTSFGINSDGSLSRTRAMSSYCLSTAFAQMSRSAPQAHPAAQALQSPTRPQEPVTRSESRDRVSTKDATQTCHYAQ